MRDLTVADAMHPGIYTVEADAPVAALATTMATRSIHCVVVEGVRRGRRGEQDGWGIVTDMDLLTALHAGEDVDAGHLAGTEPATVRADKPLADAVALMVEHDLSHVLAVDKSGRPVGVLSSLDVARVSATWPARA